MEYQEVNTGRVFVARLFDNEAIYEKIEALAIEENIQAASVQLLGGIRRAGVVTGPKNPDDMKNLEPQCTRFDDARELLAAGTIFPCDGKPSLHLHAAIGRDGKALAGCPREGADTFIILEAVIQEWTGLQAERARDPETGFALLRLADGKEI